MAALKVNGIAMANNLATMFSERGPLTTHSSVGGVLTVTTAARDPDHKIMVLADLTAAEAVSLESSLVEGDPLQLISDSYGTVQGVVDGFDAKIDGTSGRGVGRVHIQTGTVEGVQRSYDVDTIANSFSIGAATPALFGIPDWMAVAPTAGLTDTVGLKHLGNDNGLTRVNTIAGYAVADGPIALGISMSGVDPFVGGAAKQLVQVSTRLNNFSLTSASAPFLVGGGAILHGPPGFVELTPKTQVAAGDGTTAVVTVRLVSGPDGLYIKAV